jgi:hypothetical protein
MKMIKLTFTVNVTCRTSTIRRQPGMLDEILEMVCKKEEFATPEGG